MNVIGPQIRDARLARDPQWSLEELSQQLVQTTGLELTASTLSKIETGVRSVYDFEVQAFARVLAVPLTSLFEVEVSGESQSGGHGGAVPDPPG